MTLFDRIDATTPEYGMTVNELRKGLAVLQPAIEQLVRSRVSLGDAIAEFKQRYVATAVRRADGNRSKAALMVGSHRNTISRNAPRRHSRKQPQSATVAQQNYQAGA